MSKATKILQLTRHYLSKYKKSSYIGPEIRKQWASEVFKILGFDLKSSGTVHKGPVIFVANHISYVDIPLLMATLEDCVFLSKKEVSWWPIFGPASKKIGTVFVHRSSKKSRSEARLEIKRQLSENKKKIVIFPSGTTSMTGEKLWKKGIFDIAQELQIPIQPVRINYSHLRTVAYIDRDFFPYHLFQLARTTSIRAEVEIHPPILIRDVSRDLDYCRKWCTSRFESDELGASHVSRPVLTKA